MALPLRTLVMIRRMDPRDVLDVYVVINQGNGLPHILQPDEIVTGFEVTLSAEAIAIGMRLATDENAPRYAGRVFALQVSIDSAMRTSPIFSGTGVTVAGEITFSTNFCNREKQYSFGMWVIQK